jgi:hypothetical protein
MTIAIGLLAHDGLVVAADTQETIPGYWKLEQGKIAAVVRAIRGGKPGRSRAACLLSGAGNGEYVDALVRTLIERFRGEPHLDTVDEVQPAFAQILEGFHAKHVLPFAAYPRDDRPNFKLIAGCLYEGGGSTLLVSEENLFHEHTPYVAVGVGSSLAYTLLSRFYRLPMLDLWQTVLLAAYVLFHVKESVDGCGKRSDISCLQHGGRGFVRIARQWTDALEAAMGEYSDMVDPEQLRWVIGDTTDPGRKRNAARRKLAKLRAAISAPPKR